MYRLQLKLEMEVPLFAAFLAGLIATGPLALAKTRSPSRPMAKVTLSKPSLLQPRATTADYSLLNNAALPGSPASICPVKTDSGQSFLINQNQPSYLAFFNKTITNGGNSVLKYQSSCLNTQGGPIHLWDPALANQQNNPAGGPGGGGPGGMPGGGGGTPFANGRQPYPTPGSPYRGGSDGGWYSSGPDTLCKKGDKPTFQTQIPNELLADKGQSLCDVIYNTIKSDSCPGGGGPSTAAYAQQLATGEIGDMESFCPGWSTIKGDPEKRALMLMNMVAAIVKTESGWNNLSHGDGGKSLGMLQLTAATDHKHGCHCTALTNENDTLDARKNLMCGTHMIVSFMAKDRTVGKGTGEHCGGDAGGCGAQGIARSFGPFRDGRKERADILRRTSQWCRESLGSFAPDVTPESVAPAKR